MTKTIETAKYILPKVGERYIVFIPLIHWIYCLSTLVNIQGGLQNENNKTKQKDKKLKLQIQINN